MMSNFAAACNERIRRANPFAVRYVRAFDQEMFQISNTSGSEDDDIPPRFVGFVSRYIQELTQGIPQATLITLTLMGHLRQSSPSLELWVVLFIE